LYRLSLRQDNADLRLTAKGAAAGIVSDERLSTMLQREADIAHSVARLIKTEYTIERWADIGINFDTAKRCVLHETTPTTAI
jgi:tRNA uridine 5-carboxymethylaminomethyl modification enzyme